MERGQVSGLLPTDRDVYLFSSNATTLFAVDALNVICLPTNWLIHFRYDQPRVERALWNTLEKDPGALVGRRVVVSFVDQREPAGQTVIAPPGTKIYDILHISPLRTGTIRHVVVEGVLVHFYFSLGAYLRYDFDGAAASASARERLLEELLVDSAKERTTKTPRQGVYAASGPALPADLIDHTSDPVKAFQTVARVVSGRGFAPNATVFPLFLGLHELKEGKPIEQLESVAIGSGVQPQQSAYEIQEGKLYAVAVSTYHTAALHRTYFGNAGVELSFDPDYFDKLDRTRVLVLSRYDQFALPFTVRRRNRDEWTAITVQATSGVDLSGLNERQRAALPAFLGPEWIVPVKIKVNRLRKFGPLALTELLAALGIAAPGALIALEADREWIVLAFVALLVGVLGRTYLTKQG